MKHTTPFISVLICTRNRGNEILTAIHSLLAADHQNFELVIIDQSENRVTEQAVEPYLIDPRIRYFHTTTHGVSRARNMGLQLARGELMALTDDDCEVPADWLTKIIAHFERDPQIGVNYMSVLAAPHDTKAGSIPEVVFGESRQIRTIAEWRASGRQAMGFAAGMAVRRLAALNCGGFDPMLGAGEILKSGGELDLTLRMLLKGHSVFCDATNSVIHYGFRSWPHARRLYQGYSYGPAASYAKLARKGHVAFARFFVEDFWRYVVVKALNKIVAGEKPTVRGQLLGMTAGFAHGLRLALHPSHNTFADALEPTAPTIKVIQPEDQPAVRSS